MTTPTPPASALLACPFCGAVENARRAHEHRKHCYIALWFKIQNGTHVSEADMERAWNTRATPSDARRAGVERAGKEIAELFNCRGDNAAEVISSIITAELGAGEGRDGWIACADRLPPPNTHVNIVVDWEDGEGPGAWSGFRLADGTWRCPASSKFNDEDSDIAGKVTHWAALPALPVTIRQER